MSGPIESIHAYELDPAVATWQAALAASQQDLTRVEGELHDALSRAADLERVSEELTRARVRLDCDLEDIQELTRERDEARAETRRVRAFWQECSRHRDQIIAERDEARAEAAEMRAQLLRAAEQNEVLRQEITAVMRDLRRTEQQLEHTRFERDQARFDLYTERGLRAATESELDRARSRATKETPDEP